MMELVDASGNIFGTGGIQVTGPDGKPKTITTASPTGPAGGDLTGTYPNPGVNWGNGSATYAALFYPLSTNPAGYLTSAALAPYLTSATAAATYQPLDADLTSWASVTRASGFDTFVATPSSANLASLITNETGSGALVFGTSPTFTTDITTPKIIGGTGITSKITYTGSSNATPTATNIAHEFYVGNNGATEVLRILHNGFTGFNTNPSYQLHIGCPDTSTAGIAVTASSFVNIPSLGTVSNTVLLNARGFSVATDSTVLTGSYIPSFGIGLASNRSGPLLGIKNASASGYSIIVEDGNVGLFTTNPYTELQVAGNITSTWANSNFGTWYQDGTSYKLGFNTVINNRQLNLHAYTADTGGYITMSTGTVGSPVTKFRLNKDETSGAVTTYSFTGSANTGQTASTNIQGFLFTTGTRQWATGAITTQQEFLISSPTYSFVGASTITSAYTLYVNAPVAGTNATITNNYGLGVSGNAYISGNIGIGTNAHTSYSINAISNINTGGNLTFGGGDSRIIGVRTSLIYGMLMQGWNGTALSTFFRCQTSNTSGTLATGAVTDFTWTTQTWTNQTLSTEISSWVYNAPSRQWATGAITTQREVYFKTATYSFVGASTITNAYGLYVEAPTAGTNATITNAWAIGINGGIFVNAVANIVLSNAALATNATSGFTYIPTCAGTPTGVPTAYTGTAAMVYDTTNNKLYIYNGAWKSATFA